VIVLTGDRGAFAVAQDLAIPATPRWGAWGDLDGDGRLDLAVTGDGFARVFHNRGADLDPTPVMTRDGTSYTAGAWLDADGDQDLDLALAEAPGKLRVFASDGGVLGTTPLWSSLEDQDTASILAADVDGDHDVDLVVASHAASPSRLYRNQGDKTFVTAALMVPSTGFEHVSATARTRR